ncbi:hypothetical protein TSUD_15430 [Trifolium subterraneum]|uniref:Uncharacterized protein n=1 Tax=Trifolium subterraneum TaxID=3900 RepID=A0A2Z6NLZ3_TRISU|nr:hypothetical protein TSUD_15430 [Trifolium subterraneum]
MYAKDHYEMREYNIDVLEDGKDLSLCAKERPYCIYPSKGGINPTFLRDIIASSNLKARFYVFYSPTKTIIDDPSASTSCRSSTLSYHPPLTCRRSCFSATTNNSPFSPADYNHLCLGLLSLLVMQLNEQLWQRRKRKG